jgi:uncharacterized protein (TIGR03437 family)
MNGLRDGRALPVGRFAAWAVSIVAMCPGLAAQSVTHSVTLAGSGTTTASAIATDSKGSVYAAGSTTSSDFPLAHALVSQLPEPALRLSPDGKTFTAAALNVTEVFSVDASSDGRLMLAATNLGISRSSDGGVTWAASSVGPAGPALAVAVDPVNSANAYAVAVTSTYEWYNSILVWTIYRSADGGDTWQSLASYSPTPSTSPVSRIWINPQNPSTVYVFVNAALMRSDDAGATWRTIGIPTSRDPSGYTNPSGFAMAPSQPDTLYATTFLTALMKSTDGGGTWQQAAGIASAGENAIAVDPHDPSTVWLVVAAGIFKSTDGGASFTKMASPGDGSWEAIAISRTDSRQVFACDRHNVYATYDGGATWGIVASGQVDAVFTTPGKVVVAGSVSPTVYVTKFDAALQQTAFATLIGPGMVNRIAVDAEGNVLVAGTTTSHSFPTTANAMQRDFSSSSAGFLTKVRADDGALVYSTFLDGFSLYGLAVAPDGNAVIAGSAAYGAALTTRAVMSPLTGTCTGLTSLSARAFAAKIDLTQGDAIFTDFLSGPCGDAARAVAIDPSGNLYVGGVTSSSTILVTSDALIPKYPTTGSAGFVTELSAAGDRVLYSTFIGGGYEVAVNAIALDGEGRVILGGSTQAQATSGAYQRPSGTCPPVLGLGPINYSYANGDDGFVMRFAPGAATPDFLATLGGSCQDSVVQVALDSSGRIWVTGTTASSDFPTVAPSGGLGPVSSYSSPGFLAELDASGASLLYSDVSTSTGAIAASADSIYFAGSTGSAALVAAIGGPSPAIAVNQLIRYSGPSSIVPAYVPPVVAPGQIVRLEGRGIGPANLVEAKAAPGGILPALAGVQVKFNGVVAPLVSVQANEIVCVAPFELDGLSSATIQVSYNGQTSNTFPTTVAAQNIDVIAVVNQDGSPNSESNPAALHSVAALYITGAGQTIPASTTGEIYTTSAVSPKTFPDIQVNGLVEKPVFVGASPGTAAGVLQVNLWVPDPGMAPYNIVSLGAKIWTSH